MVNRSKWARKEVTTQGSDPTVVVTWRNKELDIEIEEFQLVYRTTRQGDTAAMGTAMDVLGQELHKALEEIHQMVEQERRFDGYADHKIYGGR